ncbi:MAG: hypothetical protein M3680_19455 [Myxococcota bacterium]|nr:hypothetical protein [Myxococcota bacterium]
MKSLWVVVLATAAFACGGGGGFPDAGVADGPVPGGTFSLDWALTDAQGAPISCDRVGGVTVTALLRNRAVQGGTTEVFSCGTGMGTTPLVPAGLYDIRFELNGVTGLVATATEQLGVVISSGQDTTLAPVTFEINAIGGLDLLVDSLATGGNCAGVASSGAGITAMTITLQHVLGGACEPATLMIGATPYTINCATPAEVGCIEKTTPITVSGLPSDNYQIHIRGKQNALTCYANDDQLRVPPNAMSLMRTVNLAPTGAAGCL